MRPKMRLEADRRRGFSLAEVLAALVIFSIAIIGLVQGMGSSSAIQADILHQARALLLAENALEEIRASNALELGTTSGHFTGADSDFEWESTVARTDTEGLLEVTVVISGQGAREVRLITFMRKRDEEAIP